MNFYHYSQQVGPLGQSETRFCTSLHINHLGFATINISAAVLHDVTIMKTCHSSMQCSVPAVTRQVDVKNVARCCVEHIDDVLTGNLLYRSEEILKTQCLVSFIDQESSQQRRNELLQTPDTTSNDNLQLLCHQ